MIDIAPRFRDPSIVRVLDAAPRSLLEVGASIDYEEALPLHDCTRPPRRARAAVCEGFADKRATLDHRMNIGLALLAKARS